MTLYRFCQAVKSFIFRAASDCFSSMHRLHKAKSSNRSRSLSGNAKISLFFCNEPLRPLACLPLSITQKHVHVQPFHFHSSHELLITAVHKHCLTGC